MFLEGAKVCISIYPFYEGDGSLFIAVCYIRSTVGVWMQLGPSVRFVQSARL